MDRGKRESEWKHVGGWLMGLLLSVFAGKHICPDGEVKVWQRSAEQSLLVYWAAETWMHQQQTVKCELEENSLLSCENKIEKQRNKII